MYLLQIEQILQFSAVVIFDNQYDEFLFLTVRKIQHTKKIMVPGLHVSLETSPDEG